MKFDERQILDNLFRYSIIKLPPLKKVNFSTSNYCFPLVGFGEQGNEGFYFRGMRQLMSKLKGNKGLITLSTLT